MLYCLSAEYTPQALNAVQENPNTGRCEAIGQLLEAAGGKVIAMYGIAMVVFEVPDPRYDTCCYFRSRCVVRFRPECPDEAPLHDGRQWHVTPAAASTPTNSVLNGRRLSNRCWLAAANGA
jgi:hypothetical protein